MKVEGYMVCFGQVLGMKTLRHEEFSEVSYRTTVLLCSEATQGLRVSRKEGSAMFE